MLRRFFLLSLCTCIAASAFSWGPEGHKAVAAIAMNHVKPATKQKILDILASQDEDVLRPVPDDPVLAATWPDDIRPWIQISRPDWHFIDLPLTFDGTSPSDPTTAPKLVNAKTQLVALLSGPIERESDAAQYAWIVHLVGDIHQPLHTATLFGSGFDGDGDRGGNSFYVKARVPTGPMGQQGMRKTKLHHYWDDIFAINHEANLDDLVSKLEAQAEGMAVPAFPADAAGREALIQSWIEESNALAKSDVYTQGGAGTDLLAKYPATLPQAYYQRSLNIAESQVIKAGFRLASILDAVFGE